MKLLIEFVKQEMERKNLGGFKVIDVNDPKVVQEAVAVRNRINQRILDDPAIDTLVRMSAQVIRISQMLPAPDEAKQSALVAFLVETIEIWENANNSFNDQFKTQS